MKQALLFSPYIDTYGGGEVYTLNFARSLQQSGYNITFAHPNKGFLSQAKQRFNLDLQAMVNPQAFHLLTRQGGLLQKYLLTKKFDLTFFLSDGSIPLLFSQQNIIHFQVPFTTLKTNLTNRLKLKNIDHVVCNSHFTKKIIDQQLGINSTVLYPPVHLVALTKTKKKNIILSVGRITKSLHHKRQDILIQAFQQLVDQHQLKNWELVLIGNTLEQGSKELASELQSQAKGYPIKFLTNVNYATIQKFYQESKIFWLATGFDINEALHPELVEHFGIAPVEAMSAGSVPVVINKGGPKEIVTPDKDGYTFSTINELVTRTQSLIANPKKLSTMSHESIITSQRYSAEKFYQQVQQLIN